MEGAAQKTFMPDIAILRTLSVVVVVVFHVYGMMFADHFPQTKDLYKSIYFYFNNCVIINVAMPIFVFISGYLFFYQLKKNKYQSFIQMVKKKTIRILVPYFVFGLVMMATTGGFYPFELLYGGYWHLWFLPMIYWCFIISYFMKSIDKWNRWVLLTVTLAIFGVPLLGKFIPRIMGLHNITIWYCWFFLGGVMYVFKNQTTTWILRYKINILLLLVYIAITVTSPTDYGNITLQLIISQICIIVFLWNVIHTMPQSLIKYFKPFISFSRYSFGIYIFHNWVALYLVSNTMKRIFNLQSLAQEHIILFPFMFFVVTLIVSYFMSYILLKTKIGRFLIG